MIARSSITMQMSVLAMTALVVVGCHRESSVRPATDTARLAFEIRDATGHLIPARITLTAVGGTPEPKLTTSDAGERRGRMVLSGNKIMTLDGSGQVAMPPGVYDIFVSRGIEWSLFVVPRVEIGAAGYDLRARLDHVVDTTGWLSGDFHVHAAPSWDSYVPLENRAIEFVVEGVDLIVSTDHNIVADYAPVIVELDLRPYLASMIGDELTTLHWGHFGVFPLPGAMVGQHYGTQWRHEGDGSEIFAAVRRDHPGTLIQANHPRSSGGTGYFNDERFDRRAGRSTLRGFSLAFDTIEVLNGRNISPAEEVLLDWFSMLDRGHIVTAMGNSDTHELHTTLGGYPRNYLRVPDDRPGRASETDIIGAIRGRHAFFTTGPFLELRSGRAGIGDVVTARDGKLTVDIAVAAAPWIGVDSVTLYVNGKVEKRWPVEPSQLPQRFAAHQAIVVEGDSYIVLRADGREPMWPVAGDAERTQVVPMAISNPLFVDVDGDGAYTR